MAEKGRTIVQIKIAKLIVAKCVERKGRDLEGIVIPCNLCDKTFRSRNGFRLHVLFTLRSRDSLIHHKRQTCFSH